MALLDLGAQLRSLAYVSEEKNNRETGYFFLLVFALCYTLKGRKTQDKAQTHT